MKIQEEIEKLESAWDELFFSDDDSDEVKDRMESIVITINELRIKQLEDGTIISNNSDNGDYHFNE